MTTAAKENEVFESIEEKYGFLGCDEVLRLCLPFHPERLYRLLGGGWDYHMEPIGESRWSAYFFKRRGSTSEQSLGPG